MRNLEWVDDPNSFDMVSVASVPSQGEPILLVKVVRGEGEVGYYFRLTLRGFSDPFGWLGVIPCGPFSTVEEAKAAAVAQLREWLPAQVSVARQILGREAPPILALWSRPELLEIKRDAALILQIEALNSGVPNV